MKRTLAFLIAAVAFAFLPLDAVAAVNAPTSIRQALLNLFDDPIPRAACALKTAQPIECARAPVTNTPAALTACILGNERMCIQTKTMTGSIGNTTGTPTYAAVVIPVTYTAVEYDTTVFAANGAKIIWDLAPGVDEPSGGVAAGCLRVNADLGLVGSSLTLVDVRCEFRRAGAAIPGTVMVRSTVSAACTDVYDTPAAGGGPQTTLTTAPDGHCDEDGDTEGAPNSSLLDSSQTLVVDDYLEGVICLRCDQPTREYRRIEDGFVGGQEVNDTWATNPAAGDVYEIWEGGGLEAFQYNHTDTTVDHNVAVIGGSWGSPALSNSTIAIGQNADGCTHWLIEGVELAGPIGIDAKGSCDTDEAASYLVDNVRYSAERYTDSPRFMKLVGDSRVTVRNSYVDRGYIEIAGTDGLTGGILDVADSTFHRSAAGVAVQPHATSDIWDVKFRDVRYSRFGGDRGSASAIDWAIILGNTGVWDVDVTFMDENLPNSGVDICSSACGAGNFPTAMGTFNVAFNTPENGNGFTTAERFVSSRSETQIDALNVSGSVVERGGSERSWLFRDASSTLKTTTVADNLRTVAFQADAIVNTGTEICDALSAGVCESLWNFTDGATSSCGTGQTDTDYLIVACRGGL